MFHTALLLFRSLIWVLRPAACFGPGRRSEKIRDAYMLKIFEDNQTRLPGWCNAAADGLPFCQILGEYKMDLPEYNTIEPYANMNENCPSAPPAYSRPARC